MHDSCSQVTNVAARPQDSTTVAMPRRARTVPAGSSRPSAGTTAAIALITVACCAAQLSAAAPNAASTSPPGGAPPHRVPRARGDGTTSVTATSTTSTKPDIPNTEEPIADEPDRRWPDQRRLVGTADTGTRSAAPATRLLEAGRIAGTVSDDLRLILREVDHSGRLRAAVARVDHRVDYVVEPFLDVPALRHRLVLTRQQQR